jgi:hypothetical protein
LYGSWTDDIDSPTPATFLPSGVSINTLAISQLNIVDHGHIARGHVGIVAESADQPIVTGLANMVIQRVIGDGYQAVIAHKVIAQVAALTAQLALAAVDTLVEF